MRIRRVFPASPLRRRIACFTLDLEEDYAGFTEQFDTIEQPDRLHRLLEVLKTRRIPLTVFVVTKLLETHSQTISLFHDALRPEWGSHSHFHRRDLSLHAEEIRRSQAAFQRFFGAPPQGFRAPIGRLTSQDVRVLHEQGFRYDSSIFPSLWSLGSGLRHRRLPTMPWEYDNGLLELPFAVIPTVRIVLSISYLKLLGLALARRLLERFPPEPILVIDSHLHDFIPTASRKRLPLAMRLAYKRNEHEGLVVLDWLIQHLRSQGYEFATMSELANSLRASDADRPVDPRHSALPA